MSAIGWFMNYPMICTTFRFVTFNYSVDISLKNVIHKSRQVAEIVYCYLSTTAHVGKLLGTGLRDSLCWWRNRCLVCLFACSDFLSSLALSNFWKKSKTLECLHRIFFVTNTGVPSFIPLLSLDIMSATRTRCHFCLSVELYDILLKADCLWASLYSEHII